MTTNMLVTTSSISEVRRQRAHLTLQLLLFQYSIWPFFHPGSTRDYLPSITFRTDLLLLWLIPVSPAGAEDCLTLVKRTRCCSLVLWMTLFLLLLPVWCASNTEPPTTAFVVRIVGIDGPAVVEEFGTVTISVANSCR